MRAVIITLLLVVGLDRADAQIIPPPFAKISQSNLKELEAWAQDPQHAWYYPTLLAKFTHSPDSLSLEEMFMFYFGYSTTKQYSPYKTIKEFDGIRSKTPEQRIKACESVLKEYPTNLDAWFYLATMKPEDYPGAGQARERFIRFLDAILSTGTGTSPDNAFVVISVHDEYVVLGYLGYSTQGQALVNRKGQSYDQMKCINEQGDKQEFYFNISIPFGFMAKSFSGK